MGIIINITSERTPEVLAKFIVQPIHGILLGTQDLVSSLL